MIRFIRNALLICSPKISFIRSLILAEKFPSQGSTTEEVFLFAAAGLIPSEQKLETSEQIEVHTLSMEELKTLIQKGEFKDGAGLAAILRYKFMTD